MSKARKTKVATTFQSEKKMKKQIATEQHETLVTAATEERLSEGEKAIAEHLSAQILHHPRLMHAYDTVKRVMAKNKVLSELSHMVVVGESGCGKSTLGDMIADEYGTADNEFQLGTRHHVTALMASVPSPVTPRSMAVGMFRNLGEQGRIYGTCQEITHRLIDQFKQSDVETIFLDEHQHFFSLGLGGKNGPSTKLRESMDWVKTLINRTTITFVLMGMPNLLDLIQTDEQLARRFPTIVYLKPFDRPDADHSELATFADDLLMSAVCDLTYFDDFEEFSTRQNALALYLATGGTPGRIKALVIRAACLAHQLQARRITMDHFTQAYETEERVKAEIRESQARYLRLEKARKKQISGLLINPFTAPSNDLFAACMSEAA